MRPRAEPEGSAPAIGPRLTGVRATFSKCPAAGTSGGSTIPPGARVRDTFPSPVIVVFRREQDNQLDRNSRRGQGGRRKAGAEVSREIAESPACRYWTVIAISRGSPHNYCLLLPDCQFFVSPISLSGWCNLPAATNAPPTAKGGRKMKRATGVLATIAKRVSNRSPPGNGTRSTR